MMPLNNEFFTFVIFYLCATSLNAATNATTTTTAASAMPPRTDEMILLPLSSSTTMASLSINNNYADERNVTKAVMLAGTAAMTSADLHLDEYNFVATTPKIQTTKAPSR